MAPKKTKTSLNLDEELWLRLKVVAAYKRTTISELFREVMSEWVERHSPEARDGIRGMLKDRPKEPEPGKGV